MPDWNSGCDDKEAEILLQHVKYQSTNTGNN